MLLISEDDTFEVTVYYEQKDLSLIIHEPPYPAGVMSDTFTFRRPNWQDVKSISSAAAHVDSSGNAILDPFKYMDQKVKTLLKGWTLKNGDEKLPMTMQNINKLHPDMFQYLFSKVEAKLSNNNEVVA